jgi:hypothetical protein
LDIPPGANITAACSANHSFSFSPEKQSIQVRLMLDLEIVVWGIFLLAVFVLLNRAWVRLFVRVQTARLGGKPRTIAKVIPIDSYRGRKPRRQNFG